MAMVDKELEEALWKDPLPLIKKIIDAMVVESTPLSRGAETKKLFAGEWKGTWHLGDNDNAFSCNKIIRTEKSRQSMNFMFDQALNDTSAIHAMMFKPLDGEDPVLVRFILENFFSLGARLDVVKSRWSHPRKNVVEHCWSLQDACFALNIDPWKFAIKANL